MQFYNGLFWLPNFAKHFATKLLLASLAVAQHPLGCTQNGDTHSVKNRTKILGLGVHTATGLAHSLDFANDFLAGDTVFQINMK